MKPSLYRNCLLLKPKKYNHLIEEEEDPWEAAVELERVEEQEELVARQERMMRG